MKLMPILVGRRNVANRNAEDSENFSKQLKKNVVFYFHLAFFIPQTCVIKMKNGLKNLARKSRIEKYFNILYFIGKALIVLIFF